MKAQNCMIDWLEFSVFNVKVDNIIYILNLEDITFEHKKGFYYSEVLSFDNCLYISSGIKGNAEDNHVHVKLTGRGCRFLEQKLNVTDLRMELIARLMFLEVKVSRMDICVDYDEKFVLKYLDDAYNKNLKGVRTTQICGEKAKGMTFYIGSRKSGKFFRAYEKDFESKKFDVFKDRLELVLKDEYATHEFFNENALIKIISTYMDDIKWNNEELEKGWNNMKSEKCEISPKIRHKKATLEEKVDYVLQTYGKTLKAYAEQYGTKKITQCIHEAILSQKDLRLIANDKVIKSIRFQRKLDEKKAKELEENKPKSMDMYVQLAL